MKQEAIKRMKILRLSDEVIQDFEENDRLYYSEYNGILYWMDNHPEYMKVVEEFERDYKALVYHGIFGQYEFGDCLTLFYVSKGDWQQDNADLKNGHAYVYVHNFSEPYFSESGMVAFVSINGGLKRVS